MGGVHGQPIRGRPGYDRLTGATHREGTHAYGRDVVRSNSQHTVGIDVLPLFLNLNFGFYDLHLTHYEVCVHTGERQRRSSGPELWRDGPRWSTYLDV